MTRDNDKLVSLLGVVIVCLGYGWVIETIEEEDDKWRVINLIQIYIGGAKQQITHVCQVHK